jgi:hypothetical protein
METRSFAGMPADMSQTDEELVAAIKARSTRSVLAEFVLALSRLTIHCDLEITQVAVHFHGPLARVDIAKLTPDGGHLAEWLMAFNANPADPAFASRVELPDAAGTRQ